MKDLIIIDCWSTLLDPHQEDRARLARISRFYDRLVLKIIKTQRDYRRVYIASYETLPTDPKISALAQRLRRPVIETLEPDLIKDVEVCGRSFGRCTHIRPLGVRNLLKLNHTVWIDPAKCTVVVDDYEQQLAELPEDSLPWQYRNNMYCLDLDP